MSALVVISIKYVSLTFFFFSDNRDLSKLPRRRQREPKKSNRFNEQKNNFARASRFFVHEMMWNDQILSLLENGNGKAINSTISVWIRAQSPLFSSIQNSLPFNNSVNWDNREKV